MNLHQEPQTDTIDDDEAPSAEPIVVHLCHACFYLGPKRRAICPSCAGINTLKPAEPQYCDLYFKKVRSSRPLTASSLRTSGPSSSFSSSRSFGGDEGSPFVSPVSEEHMEGSDDSDPEDEGEEENGFEPAEPAHVARVSSFDGDDIERMPSSDEGVDHVFSGGIPRFHAFMLSASPGGGKSTLTRQLSAGMSELGLKTMIAAGEESGEIAQVEFKRLKLYKRFPKGAKKVLFTGSADTDAVISAAKKQKVDILFVDSLSVLSSKNVDGGPGDPSQLNYAAYHLMQAAHAENEYEGTHPFTVLMIVHLTKGGKMAGTNRAKHWTDGAFMLEHYDPAISDAAVDQDHATGYVRLRVLAKYRRGSNLPKAYYRFTDAGLMPWDPEAEEAPKKGAAKKGAAKKAAPKKAAKKASAKSQRKRTKGKRP